MTIATGRLLADSILDEQIRIEERSIEDGVARYNELAEKATKRGDGASLKPAERVLVGWFGPMVEAIREDQKSTTDKGVTIWGPVFRQIDAERMAVIVLHTVIGECLKNPGGVRTVQLQHSIGKGVIAEINMDMMREQDKDIRQRRTERIKAGEDRKTVFEQERELVAQLDQRFRRANPTRVNWWARKKSIGIQANYKQVCSWVGGRLLWHMMECVAYDENGNVGNIINQELRIEADGVKGKRRVKNVGYVKLEPWAISLIDEGHDMRRLLRPRYLPMIVPPYPFETDQSGKLTHEGGYVKIRTPFISKPTREQKQALEKANLSRVIRAHTAISRVGWRVNARMLDVIKTFWEQGGGLMGIPHKSNLPHEPRPAGWLDDAELWRHWDTLHLGEPRPTFKNSHRFPKELSELRWENVPKDVRAEYKRRSAKTIAENIRRIAMRQEFLAKLGIAEMFKDRPAFYFPHQFDFRGRMYAIPVHLNHQGDDVCRGILELAEGKAPGPDGRRWLKIHAANLYGMDGVSFDERIAWVDENMENIRDSAHAPLDTEWWQHADESEPGKCDGSPWQFLAACMAIVDPDGAGAHMPIALDGTANGLQHYTAIGRDAAAAPAVNMVPSDKPNSIYRNVASVVDSKVREDTDTIVATNLLAKVGSITKPLVKQPTMTQSYGVTDSGARSQVSVQLESRGFEGQELWDTSTYLAGVIMESIGEVCKSAVEIMDWLRTCSRLIAKKKRLVTWTSPIGFPVVQPYRRWKTMEINTQVQRVIIQVENEDAPVDIPEQKNGSAPNFVHSVDVSHLMQSAIDCDNLGVTLAARHDCYITHAATGTLMLCGVLNAFKEIHTPDLLAALLAEWRTLHPDIKFPEPPERGTYDINTVTQTSYMFH